MISSPNVKVQLYQLVSEIDADYRHAAADCLAFMDSTPAGAQRIVRTKLHSYLKYCQRFSPYWKERWPKEVSTFSIEESEDVLAMLPPLSKEDLRVHGEQLRIRPEQRFSGDGFPALRHVHAQHSGGSTGVPVTVWQDRRWESRNRAVLDLAYRASGLTPGMETFYLWGSNNEIGDIKKTFRKRLGTWLRGLVVMPAYSMNADRVRHYADVVNRLANVQSAICFVSALETFTTIVEREGIKLRRIQSVFTGGGMLSMALRERTLRVWAENIYDTYGARDAGIMAAERPEIAGMPTFPWHAYLEILDECNRRAANGTPGVIHLTQVENHSMALLRMSMGDVGTVGATKGWNGPVLTSIRGRAAEHLSAPDGSQIDPSAIIHMIGALSERSWLRKFQLVQSGLVTFVLRIETWSEPSAADLDAFETFVRDGLTNLCHAPVTLAIKREHVIAPAASGKHLYCVQAFEPGANPPSRA